LAISVNENWTAAALVHSIYPCDEGRCLIRLIPDTDGAGLASNPSVADINIVVARGKSTPCARAQCGVQAAGGVVIEGPATDSGVVVACCVARECIKTAGRISAAGCILLERLKTVRRVVAAVCILLERVSTAGRVELPGGVEEKRTSTVGRVIGTSGVALERSETKCCVAEATGKVEESVFALSRVRVWKVTQRVGGHR